MKQVKFSELYKTFIVEGVKELEEMYVKTGKINPHMFEELKQIDPTETKKYLQWMIKRVMEERSGESLSRLKEFIPTFDSLANKNVLQGSEKDIFQYKTIEKLYDKIKQYEDVKTAGEAEREIKAGADKVFENQFVVVVHPKNMEASCAYGKGTKWCTAAEKSYNFFDDYYYRNSINLYYVIPKPGIKLDNPNYSKIAVAVYPNGKKEFYDVTDRSFGDEEAAKIFKKWQVPF